MTSLTRQEARAAVRIELGWPSSDLSPNARGHWSKRSRASKSARMEAKAETLRTGIGRLPDGTPIKVTATFHPPARYGYDKDGLLSRMKPFFDGISDAIGVDDKHFSHGEPTIGPIIKGGRVVVDIEAMP